MREWTDTAGGLARRVRGGAYDGPSSNLAAATSGADVAPGTEAATLGFRVVPEPDGFWSLAVGRPPRCSGSAVAERCSGGAVPDRITTRVLRTSSRTRRAPSCDASGSGLSPRERPADGTHMGGRVPKDPSSKAEGGPCVKGAGFDSVLQDVRDLIAADQISEDQLAEHLEPPDYDYLERKIDAAAGTRSGAIGASSSSVRDRFEQQRGGLSHPARRDRG